MYSFFLFGERLAFFRNKRNFARIIFRACIEAMKCVNCVRNLLLKSFCTVQALPLWNFTLDDSSEN
jgi:hypothetical protein